MSPPGWASVVTLKVAFPPSPFTWDRGLLIVQGHGSYRLDPICQFSVIHPHTCSTLTPPHLENVGLVIQILVL